LREILGIASRKAHPASRSIESTAVFVDDPSKRDRIAGAQRLHACVFSNRHKGPLRSIPQMATPDLVRRPMNLRYVCDGRARFLTAATDEPARTPGQLCSTSPGTRW
jgi:hypothetical protein